MENDQHFREALAALDLSPSKSADPKMLADAWQSLLDERPSLQEAWNSRLEAHENNVIRNTADELQVAPSFQPETNDLKPSGQEEGRTGVGTILPHSGLQNEKAVKLRRLPNFYRYAASVIVLLSLAFGGYIYLNRKNINGPGNTVQQTIQDNILPGGNRAVLILADGSRIILDSAADGKLSQQGKTQIIKLDDGQLAYNAAAGTSEVLYNTISTPRGGQYQVVLPDGSKVWLNSASSLRFPTAFTGAEREVALTGEAYFEVEENPAKPFIVSSLPSAAGGRGVEIKVLGTHFNVNSYDDESSIKVSLLKGSVQVANLNKENATNPAVKEVDTKILRPGEQAELSDANPLRVNDKVDMDEVLAWKNGLFRFSNADIETVMKQVERWYDVDVVYEGEKPDGHYRGKVPRDVKASEMLKIIEASGVQYRIENKKIIIMK